MNMRVVDAAPFAQYVGTPISADLGMKPGLAWLPISNLRIDGAYQREILRNGARNIGKIARHFDWSLFGIVVVANVGDNLFAIVDGQHRTIAAAMRGIFEVPCIIIEASPGKQAEAFAAINGAVTAISNLAIFAAEVTAGKPEAVALRDACARADVTICRYPVPANVMKFGETVAIVALQKAIRSFGANHLTLVLRCIQLGANRRPGLVKAPIIKALSQVLDAEKSFTSSPARLMTAMASFDFAKHLTEAEVEATRHRQGIHVRLAMRIFDHLDGELGS